MFTATSVSHPDCRVRKPASCGLGWTGMDKAGEGDVDRTGSGVRRGAASEVVRDDGLVLRSGFRAHRRRGQTQPAVEMLLLMQMRMLLGCRTRRWWALRDSRVLPMVMLLRIWGQGLGRD